MTGFEWCLGLLKQDVYDEYRSGEEFELLDHPMTDLKVFRVVDGSGCGVQHLPGSMKVEAKELMEEAGYWLRMEEGDAMPRHYCAAVIVMWLPEQAFSIRGAKAVTDILS